MSQNWIEIFFQNYVESMKVICGHHVPLLSMDACTSCQAKQNMSVGDDLVGWWDMMNASTLERLSALMDMCMEYLEILPNATSNTIQLMASLCWIGI